MQKNLKYFILLLLLCLSWDVSFGQTNAAFNSLPKSTQLTISKANVYNQGNAILQVFLVVNAKQQSLGSGFLIKSGQVITNAHVVHGAQNSELKLYAPNGQQYDVSGYLEDTVRDLSIITLTAHLSGGFILGNEASVQIGHQVYTWGYPFGYSGVSPLLSVGYISGINMFQPSPNHLVRHFIVNGAFNHGNSGGPLIDSGRVIGVVQSKAEPMPQPIISVLQALKNNSSGMQYSQTDQNGRATPISEAQLIEQVLEYYKSLTQVMIGEAVSVSELRAFLNENHITGF